MHSDARRSPVSTVRASIGPPSPPDHLVSRARLTSLLDRAASLTLVVAPPGSGKTVLAAEWLRRRLRADEEVRWLSVGDHETLETTLSETSLNEAVAPGQPPMPVVVDDAHLLPPDSIALLHRVLSATPETARIVLLSRRDLPLPLVPLDLAGRLLVVRAGQLGFTDEEARALVRSHAPLATDADVAQLQEHTRGWAAALILAARTLDTAEDPRTAHLMMRSTEQPVLDYLLGDALDGLPAESRQVLVATCHEREVSAASVVAMSGHPDAAERLTALARDGFLVTAYPSADRGLVWRLHPLLREALRRQTRYDVTHGVAAAHVSGVAFDRAAGNAAGAVRHAVLSGDQALLAQQLLDLGPDLLAVGRVAELDEGLRHLSGPSRAAHPQLLGIEALCAKESGDLGEALRLLAESRSAGAAVIDAPAPELSRADQQLRADVARLHLWAARFGWADLPVAITEARAVLTSPAAPTLSITRSCATLLELASAEAWQGDLAAAAGHARSALGMARSLRAQPLLIAALGLSALLDSVDGAMQSARAGASECLELAATSHLDDRVGPSRARMALAWAEFQSLDLDAAAEDLERSLDTPSGSPDPLVLVLGMVLRARLLIEDGHLQDAERSLAMPLVVPLPLPGFALALMSLVRAQLAAATGDDVELAHEIQVLLDLGRTGEAGLYAAIQLAYEGEVVQAIASLDDMAADPSPQLLVRSAVEAVRLALLLLVGDIATARALLPHVLTVIGTHRHLHVLTTALRGGEGFLASLREEGRRGDAHPYAAEALTAMERYELAYLERRRPRLEAALAERPAPPVPEPRGRPDRDRSPRRALTPRELEVFEQLALGGAYGDIARALFVTENTVKTHLASIYRKLGVERRAEALQVGRDRGLITIRVVDARRLDRR